MLLTGSSALWRLGKACQRPEAESPDSSPRSDSEYTHYSRNTEPALQPDTNRGSVQYLKTANTSILPALSTVCYRIHTGFLTNTVNQMEVNTHTLGSSSVIMCGAWQWVNIYNNAKDRPGSVGWRYSWRSA